MKSGRLLPRVCLPFGLLLLGGCSDEPEPPPVEMPRPLAPGEVELDASDIPPPGDSARPTGSVRRGSDADVATDLPLQPDPREGAYQIFLDAQDRELRTRCGCRFEELGHASAEACFENLRRPDFAKFCELAAFSRYSADLGPRYACFAEARNASASCVEERGCGALSECEATRDTAREGCFGLVYADIGFAELDTGCEARTRLGRPSGCPDLTLIGSPLGDQVFEGNTTGAGDDVTLSCYPQFDEFGSPDLVVQWQAPAAGTYAFSTANSGFVTQVGILDGCGGAELACASSDGSTFGGATVWVRLEAQQTVSVVLEGYDVINSGYVRLNVSRIPDGL